MFLVKDQPYGETYLVFTWEDPRKEGYRGEVTEGVNLDYNMEAVHAWPDGHERPEACVGRKPGNPNCYKVFRYSRDLREEGYQPVPGRAVVPGSWSDYVHLRHLPLDPEQTDDEGWYDYLDKLDEASRRRGERAPTSAKPEGASRDAVAAWVARKHLVADSSVREIWYLPQGAPPEEIRFLEVNDRVAGNGDKVEPVDFGLDIGDLRFLLFVADLTSEQLQQIKQDPGRLPQGWSLQGSTTWGRRG